jgi:hypothetical protein
MTNPAPSSFFGTSPGPPAVYPNPNPASYYTQTAAFSIVYYGALQTAPTVDPFGNPVVQGALYWSIPNQALYVFNATSTWAPYAPTSTTLDWALGSTGGPVIAAGAVLYRRIPYQATATSWTLLADVSGSCVVDIQRCTFANYSPPTHPASGDSITNSQPPKLVSQISAQSAGPLGWSTLNTGDVLAINVQSLTSIHQLYIQIQLQRL